MIRFKFSYTSCVVVSLAFLSLPCLARAEGDSEDFVQEHSRIWQTEPGSGFRSGAQSLGVTAGVSTGLKVLGGSEAHDMAMLGISYGYVLTDVVGAGHWWQGNLELRGELSYGAQYHPDGDWLINLTPHIRYNFATGTHLVPFIGVGAGLSATGIGAPDLSGAFQFNAQATAGAHWFVSDDWSVTLEARFLHVSCAGISSPNHGLNGVVAMVGVSHYF